MSVANSTFSGNSAADSFFGGGGIRSEGSSTTHLSNTLIANSPSGGDCDVEGPLPTNLNNLVEDGSCSAALSGDPMLDALADNGGPTQTFSLLAGSPAIDAVGPDCPPPLTDQREVSRPQPAGGNCDIGSFEIMPPPPPDLAVSKTDSPDPVVVGDPLTYTITVNNAGEGEATDVMLTDTLPSTVDFVSVSPSGGCGEAGGVVTCDLGDLASGANAATVTIVVEPTATGSITNSVAVAATETDENPGNDSDTEETTVNPAPAADLAVTKSDSPDPVQVGSNLTYTVTVTNSGPSNATDVTLTDTLPAGVSFVSASASQGSCSGTSPVVCTLGSLAASANATVTLMVTPTAAGTITNTASVSGNPTDPTPGNDSDTEQTTVNAPSGPLCFGQPATIIGTPGNDTLNGTSGDDVIVGRGGNDRIDGRGGHDKICGNEGNDRISGSDGNDMLSGDEGNDVLDGGNGNDQLDGGKGIDALGGGNGQDILSGGEGNDALFGEDGNDTLDGGPNADFLRGGSGFDTCSNGENVAQCEA